MKYHTRYLLSLGALMLYLIPTAAGEPDCTFSLLNFSRAFSLPEEQQGLSRMISSSSSFALTLRITPEKGYTVSTLDIQELSMKDRLGNDLQPDFLTHAPGENNTGHAYVDIYAKDTMYGDWVHVTGTVYVQLSQSIKEHPAQTIEINKPSASNVRGVDVNYELDNAGTLHIYITGEDSVRKVQGIICDSPDGKELRTQSSGSFTSGDGAFKSVTINFEDKVTALNVMLKTYEGLKEVKLPLNFRVGMTGMLPPPKDAEKNRRIAPPKFKL